MKYVNYTVVRGLIALLLGGALILWPEMAITYLVIAIGILFIVPGVWSLLNYLFNRRDAFSPKPSFPIEAAGSILFGAWLVAMPGFFVNIFMYILGALLVIAGIQQIVFLVRARRWSTVRWGFYIVPALILLAGILILAYPFEAAANTFIIFGIAAMVYGVSELVNSYRFRKRFTE